jgi:hypothetical protein
MAAELIEEAHLPRWRRQSLNEARKAGVRSPIAAVPRMRFRDQPDQDVPRALVRYDLVRITDIPDEITGTPVGDLQSGDEVEVLERRGVWVRVRTPLGIEGWVHRTTLGSQAPAAASAPASTATAPAASSMATDTAPDDGSEPMLESMLASIAAQRKGRRGGQDGAKPPRQAPSSSPS